MVRRGYHSHRRQNNANEQAEWQLPKSQKIVTDNTRQCMALVAPIDPLTLLRASVTLLIMHSSSLQYAELNYGHEGSQPPLLRPALTCLVLAADGHPVF